MSRGFRKAAQVENLKWTKRNFLISLKLKIGFFLMSSKLLIKNRFRALTFHIYAHKFAVYDDIFLCFHSSVVCRPVLATSRSKVRSQTWAQFSFLFLFFKFCIFWFLQSDDRGFFFRFLQNYLDCAAIMVPVAPRSKNFHEQLSNFQKFLVSQIALKVR